MDNGKAINEQLEAALEDLNPEQIIDFVQSAGIELTDEQLKSIAGGLDWSEEQKESGLVCPFCQSKDLCYMSSEGVLYEVRCNNCGSAWRKGGR